MAAGSAGDADGGKTNKSMSNIAESGTAVKARNWAEAEAQREHEQNQKAFGRIRASLMGGLPVLHNGIKYRCVSGIIYRLHPNGGFRVQAELKDYCGNSVTVAAPRAVDVPGLDDKAPEPEPKAEPSYITQLSATLKKALRTEIPVICNGEEYRKLSAIIYRLDPESHELRLQVELENCGGRIVTVAAPHAAEIQNPGTCDEMCGIGAQL